MIELKPHEKQENKTKEILEKIAQVNKKQGLVKNPFKTRYYPLNGRSTNFQVPLNPYYPIADYMQQNPVPSYYQDQVPVPSYYQNEEVPPGQYIKRKIIHQESILVPNPAFIPPQEQTVDNIKNIMENAYYQSLTPQLTRQSWQWPLGNMFPIIFKDPFTHMMNAMTTIVEYGPDAGKPKPCAKSLDDSTEDNPNYPTIDIKDLLITNNPDDPVNLTISITPKTRQEKKQDPSLTEDFSKEEISSEESSEEEIEKAVGAALSQENNKKFFSKDNTGNGIFVQRLKVRKGGVAIAGPGGIATAGSGGTAIVGPNGFAYTHPDSLAIAGSGTKVVAVDPSVNLSDIVFNSTKTGGYVPRLGKVVAVGPVIYYNKS